MQPKEVPSLLIVERSRRSISTMMKLDSASHVYLLHEFLPFFFWITGNSAPDLSGNRSLSRSCTGEAALAWVGCSWHAGGIGRSSYAIWRAVSTDSLWAAKSTRSDLSLISFIRSLETSLVPPDSLVAFILWHWLECFFPKHPGNPKCLKEEDEKWMED